MDSELVILTLSRVRGLGSKTLYDELSDGILGQMQSDADIYDLYLKLSEKSKRIEKITPSRFAEIVAETSVLLEKSIAFNIHAITRFDKYYPTMLHHIKSPPALLFAKGNLEALNKPGIAIVGTRNLSEYGRKIGERLGELVAKSGNIVISGLAVGADTSGHVGCLKARGITIAIVATSLEKVYPKENRNLEKQIIASNGCILSEYPLGTDETPYYFVARDRLQCGMADGLIVVETGVTGGTFNAVKGSLELKKPVGCYDYSRVSGHYDKYKHSWGNKLLIDEGKAVPLYDTNNINSFIKMCANSRKKRVQFEQLSLNKLW